MSTSLSSWRARPVLSFSIFALALTAARLAALFVSEANLGPDEAQYWVWSGEPALGYYSKPPFIAWTIAASTALFGNAEWAVRLAAPFFHLGAAYFLFALARRLYDDAVGFWTGVGWLTLPGVSLSSMLITTDAPLLFFWAAALYCFFRLIERANGGARSPSALFWAVALGASVGFGLLSKYAMIYFPLGAALAVLVSTQARKGLAMRDAAIAALVAGAIVAPNLAWNAAHEFHTLSHTAANANWGGSMFHPAKLFEFLGAQAGVFGPIPILLLIWGLARLPRRLAAAGEARGRDLALLALAAPPLAIVSMQAFVSRAHANWAAAAYPAALVLVTAWAFRARIGAAIRASVGLNLVACLVFLAGLANFALVDALGLSGAVKPVRGWAPQGAAVAAAAEGFDAVLVDDRELMGALLYYARGGPPVVALDSNRRVDHHYEAFMAFDPERQKRVLFVSERNDLTPVQGRFGGIAPAGEITADLSPGRRRTLYLFALSDPAE
ncbi:ArnT family glycosyltransferase [Amphiplicatus metriothermophilus]|uniref:Dolichyl-phosphate-mannose-protein mannosyltransferase n=1 Tax=Amphiplicatus metriothermophilus TaxID=1519374 RepID=A0A239PIY7_9PROT|nr:glycosyltransferase family 39 protein [Amphiplicatus metriothermophilus]MBB5517920.1 4-amino-4-deoxy-L-arabinose transferase-like glycosyltransferase [Amphiplicatus metriothermophilus]SNT67746.1 Dolichyl-phosphate-mannose-protein mannosyltransferase [Amphiplicatus metriothermophilus]